MVFACFVFFVLEKVLIKIWNSPDFVLIYYTTDLYPPQTLCGKLFFTKFIFYFHAPVFSCMNLLWSSVRIFSFCENLFFLWECFWTLLICENFFLFMIIYENLFLFMIICENLFLVMINYFITYFLSHLSMRTYSYLLLSFKIYFRLYSFILISMNWKSSWT